MNIEIVFRILLLVFITTLLLLSLVINFSHIYKPNLNFKRVNQANIDKQDRFRNVSYCFRDRFKTILLIVVYNSPLYDHLPLLHKLYGHGFQNIIFCGPEHASSPPWILKTVTSNGYFTYEECTARSMNLNPNYAGYLVINDDLFLNYLKIKNYNLFKIWEGPVTPNPDGIYAKGTDWYWWGTPWGVNNCFKALEKVRSLNKYSNLLKNLSNTSKNDNLLYIVSGESICYGARADTYYIPGSMAKNFTELSNIFKENNVFLEIAVPTIITLLSDDVLRLNGIYLPKTDVTYKTVLKSYYSELIFIHPIKMNYGKESLDNIQFLKNYSNNASSIIIC